MINKFLIFIFILIANFAFSQDQEATILFNDGSAIEGFGSINKNNIYFRASLDDKADSWSYDMVKGITFFGFESTVKYEYVSLDEFSHPEPQLIEVVEEGNVTLYARVRKIVYVNSNSLNSNVLNPYVFNSNFLNSNNSNITMIRSVSNDVISYQSAKDDGATEIFVKRVNEKFPTSLNWSFYKRAEKYFSDCELLSKKIDKGEFSKNKILEIVQYYNDICAE
jgi:hypothetical protein